MPADRKVILPGLLLIGLCLIVYSQVAGFGLLLLDDQQLMNYIAESDPSFSSLLWQGLTQNPEACYYYAPLTWLSFLFSAYLLGSQVGIHHLVNLAVHILTVLILFGTLASATGSRWRSFFVAALFAIHPLNIGTVVVICGRYTPLSVLFCLLSLAAYIRYAKNNRITWYGVCFLFYLMALFSKLPSSYFFIAFFLMDFWPLRRMGLLRVSRTPVLETGEQYRPDFPLVPWQRLVAEKVPFFLVCLIGILFSWYTYSNPMKGAEITIHTVVARFLNLSVMICNYIFRVFVPVFRNVLPNQELLPVWQILPCFFLLAGVTIVAFRSAAKHAWFITGWLWFLALIIPHLLIRSGDIVDRSGYIPIVGLLIVLVWGGARVSRLIRIKKTIMILVAGLLVGCLMVYGRWYAGHWKNFDTVDQYVREHDTPLDEEVLYNFINMLYSSGRYDKAAWYFERLWQADPDNIQYNFMAGLLAARKGDFVTALAYYDRTIAMDPGYVPAYVNRASVLARMGRVDEAIAVYRSVLQQQPEFAPIHTSMAVLLLKKGNAKEAASHLRRALQINPADERARQYLDQLEIR